VQTPKEALDKIPLDIQRHLINNFKNATELGAEVIQKKEENIAKAILETIQEKQITTICLGKPHIKLWQIVLKTNVFNQLLKTLSESEVDLVILS
jgi:two-component system sensor histidine kinase KdpD